MGAGGEAGGEGGGEVWCEVRCEVPSGAPCTCRSTLGRSSRDREVVSRSDEGQERSEVRPASTVRRVVRSQRWWWTWWHDSCWAVVLHLALLTATLTTTTTAEFAQVRTSKGSVLGRVVTAHTKTRQRVQEFLGIPYAKPPVGRLRFRYPEPIEAWSGVYNATKKPNTCYQIFDTAFGNFSGSNMWNPNTPLSEDCLYINVWSPHPRPTVPVVTMVWIYGGGFYSGSSSLQVYDGRTFAAHNNVVLVSFQYRVASLGFLAFGREDAPGNVGLFDQVLALQWVKDNVEYFGGDPSRITLFGESAGSVSVSLHLISPLSQELFHRAILQSGSALTRWAVMSNDVAKERGLRLAEGLRCPHDGNNMDAVMECLRKADPLDIINNDWVVLLGVSEFPFVAVVDGKFLVEPVVFSLERRAFKKTSLLVGTNLNEGSWFNIYFLTELLSKSEDVRINREQFKIAMRECFSSYNQFGQEAIVFQYTDWTRPYSSEALLDGLDKAVGDYHYSCALLEWAKVYADAGENVYTYYFTHRSSRNPWPRWMGVMHGDEINYVFGEPLDPSKGYQLEEERLSRRMQAYWTNFAKTGNPNYGEDGRWTNQEWKVYNSDTQIYLPLSTNTSDTARQGPRIQQCAFWKYYLPQLTAATADISQAEIEWKIQFRDWSTKYIVDWKAQFDQYLINQQRSCNAP